MKWQWSIWPLRENGLNICKQIEIALQMIDSSSIQGEEYKLFWPEKSEFVRMASRFGAKIVPFGVVGEDDFGEVSLRTSFLSD